MVTAKQRAWRKKFAARYGKKKKTRRARRVRVVKQRRRPRPMARRRRGRKGRRKNKAIPLLPTITAVWPAYHAYEVLGLTKTLPAGIVQQYTGYNLNDGSFNQTFPVRAGGMVIMGYIGHKVASRIGVNKHLKKLTMGYLEL